MKARPSFRVQALMLTAPLCSLLFFAAPRTAHGSLQVVGKSRHAGIWQRVYDHLPAAWKTGQTVVVREVSEAELNAGVTDGEPDDLDGNTPGEQEGQIDGMFEESDADTGAPTIRLANTLTDDETRLVFAHEYGHFVWSTKLTRMQRRNYRRLWQDQERTGNLVTGYAREDPEEGFAEAFAYYVQKPSQLRRKDMESWRFLQSLLREADEPDVR